MNNKTLAVGPSSGPVTGQLKAFNTYVEGTSAKVDVVDKYIGGGNGAMVRLIRYAFSLINCLLRNRYSHLYITTSRTTFGFFIDAYAIIIFKVLNDGKVVNHLHGADFIGFRERFFCRRLVDWIYNKIDISIVLSESMKEQYHFYDSMSVVVVSNFSDSKVEDLSSFQKKEFGIELRVLKILYLSNLIYSKGIYHVIKAVSELVQEGNNISLDIAGNFMPDQFMTAESLENMCSFLWSDSITYLGSLTGSKVINVLNENDVMCLPTFYPTEAQPLCLIEGMAHGMHIITTKHNYNIDFLPLDFSSVVFVETDNIASIKEALLNVYNKGISLPSQMKNYDYFLHNFSLKKYISSIDGILE